MAVKRGGLGKGLDSLIPEGKAISKSPVKNEGSDVEKNGEQMVKINKIEPNREQPRRTFEEDSLLELADSIKQFGVLQPLLVQKKKIIMKLLRVKEDGEQLKWLASKKYL